MADATNQGTENDVFTFESVASKEFPPCPEGPTKVIVSKAQLKMKKKPAKFLKEGDDPDKEYPYVILTLQTEHSFEMDGQVRKHNVWLSLKVSDHERSAMYDFFTSTMGMEVPLNTEKKISLNQKIVKTDDYEDKVLFPQFENLEFSVVVKSNKSDDGKVYSNVDSIFATPEQKKANADLFLSKA